MLYLEELVDAVIAEEGQTLMGLEFLTEALNLPMSKIELLFKKSLSEYSERRPMKKTEVFDNFTAEGYITMPEGTTSCRVARYGILPNQMPRFFLPSFGEQYVEFDPHTLQCRVWPPVMPLRLTYTQKYVPTRNILIERMYQLPYETDNFDTILDTSYSGKTLSIQRAVIVKDPVTLEEKEEILTMAPTGEVVEEESFCDGLVQSALLEGTLGTGKVNLKTREVSLELLNNEAKPLFFSYYPKYSVVKELDLGNYIFTKLFASKLLEALASLRAQATQEKLHNIDLTSDELYTRVQELKREVREVLKNTISYGGMAPM